MADDGERKRGRSNNFSSDGDYDDDAKKKNGPPTPKQLQRRGGHRKGLLGKKALENPETKRILVNITAALRSPGYLFKKLPDSVSVSTRRFSAGGMIIGANAVLHFILEAWGDDTGRCSTRFTTMNIYLVSSSYLFV